MDLAELITSSRAALSRFDYDHYTSFFQAFEGECVPFFETLKSVGTEQAAGRLMDELEERRSCLSSRERKRAEEEEKQVLALFLSPCAVRRGGLAAAFAEAMNREWNERYPRNTYRIGSYEKILKGFDANLLGMPLRKSKKRD